MHYPVGFNAGGRASHVEHQLHFHSDFLIRAVEDWIVDSHRLPVAVVSGTVLRSPAVEVPLVSLCQSFSYSPNKQFFKCLIELLYELS